jgi:hypothetical protein
MFVCCFFFRLWSLILGSESMKEAGDRVEQLMMKEGYKKISIIN